MHQSIDPAAALFTKLQNFADILGLIESSLQEMNIFIKEAVNILDSQADFKLDKLQKKAQAVGNIFEIYAQRDRLNVEIEKLGQESIDTQYMIAQFNESKSIQIKNTTELRERFNAQGLLLAESLDKKYKQRLQEFNSRNLNRSPSAKTHLQKLIPFRTAHEFLIEFIKIAPVSIMKLNPKYINNLKMNCDTLQREIEKLELNVAHETSDTSVAPGSGSNTASSASSSSSSSTSSSSSYTSTSADVESDLAYQQAVQNSLRETHAGSRASSSSSHYGASSSSSTASVLLDSKFSSSSSSPSSGQRYEVDVQDSFPAELIPTDPVALLAAFISSGRAETLQSILQGKGRLIELVIPDPSASNEPEEDKENKIFSSSSSDYLFAASAPRRKMLEQLEDVRKAISQLAGPTNEENVIEEVSLLIKEKNQLRSILATVQSQPSYPHQEGDVNRVLALIDTIDAKIKPFAQIFPETVHACLESLEQSTTLLFGPN